MEKGWDAPPFSQLRSFLLVLALLVGHGARGLTSGLAGGLALAAAAVSGAVLQSCAVERLHMLHSVFPPMTMVCRDYNTSHS